MFAKPRAKKSILPPHNKKRKATFGIEEISFDNEARSEFLTGFHKRKQQRIKNAQEEAAKRARQEKIELRKQARDGRRREVEEHVSTVNRLLQESEVAGGVEQGSDDSADEWDGFPDQPNLDIVDHEEEYIDEDRYTTVTVESVSVSRDGLYKPQVDEKVEEETDNKDAKEAGEEDSRPERPKKKKKKFRYETKIERQLTERKRRMKSRS
ncbi:nucleolar protein 12-domain-containing protein [Dactylonectria estremocensis]|uniref:Nucleolar protein 12-domain-containing protein n=1 Tax=Dactylonectria estremocensis TaxID=1079267 RepID=A0A9P9F2R7_9HYPO|nr:nucleolar protein 12-domain-containing protein [Dactylonectria estremocensis]